MAGRVLRSDTITQSATVWHDQPADDSYIIESVQDVEDIIDLNKAQYNSTDERARFSPLNSSVDIPIARIDMVTYMELVREGIINLRGEGDEKAFTKWLNDPENRAYRLRPGRV